jgi:antitoxin component of MazEF toxin-antitoxin module
MATVYKVGNSLAAIIPSHAAKALGLSFRTPLQVLVFEDEIRIRNATTRSAKTGRARNEKQSKLVMPAEEPW